MPCLDDPLGGRSPVAKLGISLPCPPCALTADRGSAGSLPGMIPEIDIWRVANLMLKRYGDLAEVESARRADELWEDGDAQGVAIWRRVMGAIEQLVNTTPHGLLHQRGNKAGSCMHRRR